MRFGAIQLSSLASLIIGTFALPARAEMHLDGKWRQSSLKETFSIQQWLDEGCGRAPQSSTQGGGEVVDIRMEGDELAFLGGGRVYRTNQCYDPMPTLSRESHSRVPDGKTWRTRCVTPPADPRKTVLNTLVVVTSDTHIDLIETGRYEITLENGRCMADVRRTRSFDLVQDNNAAPTTQPTPAPAPAPKPEPKPATCSSPGDPSRLEVRPSRKLLRTGESFKFRSIVLDAKGCETRTATTWKLAPDQTTHGITVDGTGKVTVANDAVEANVEVIATAAGKDARVVVEIASPARYDELLARSGLNASGENDEASTATIASQSLGGGEGKAEDRAKRRRMLFLGIVGGVLLALGMIAIALMRRSRRAKLLLEEADERHEARVQQALDRRRQREAEHAEQQRAHDESVEAAKQAAAQAPAKQPQRMVCPSCGRDATAGTIFCPHDGTKLEASAYPVHPAVAQQRPPASRGKICPTCGERFDGNADYCGKDGTHLVLLN